jgi:hypothetical protein
MRWQNCHLKREVRHCMQWRMPTPWSSAGLANSGHGGPGYAMGGQPPPPEGGPRVPTGTCLRLPRDRAQALGWAWARNFLKKLWDENLGFNFFFFNFLGSIMCYFCNDDCFCQKNLKVVMHFSEIILHYCF